MNDNNISISASSSLFSLGALSAGYITLFFIGALIGLTAWYYKLVNANPPLHTNQAVGEAFKQIGMSAVAMPAMYDISSPFLHTHAIDSISTKLFVAAIASFMIVELIGIGIKLLSSFKFGG